MWVLGGRNVSFPENFANVLNEWFLDEFLQKMLRQSNAELFSVFKIYEVICGVAFNWLE